MLAFLNKEKTSTTNQFDFKKEKEKNLITKISNLLILNLRKDNLEGSKV